MGGWRRGVKTPQEVPRGEGALSSLKGVWPIGLMEVGRGSGRRGDREKGRWLQECDLENRLWPRGFPERFLPPSLRHSLLPPATKPAPLLPEQPPPQPRYAFTQTTPQGS